MDSQVQVQVQMQVGMTLDMTQKGAKVWTSVQEYLQILKVLEKPGTNMESTKTVTKNYQESYGKLPGM